MLHSTWYLTPRGALTLLKPMLCSRTLPTLQLTAAGSLKLLNLGLCSTKLCITKLNPSRHLTTAQHCTVQAQATHLEGKPEQGGGSHVKGKAPRLLPSSHAPRSSPLPRIAFHHSVYGWHVGVHRLLGEGLHVTQQIVTLKRSGCCRSLDRGMLGADRWHRPEDGC